MSRVSRTDREAITAASQAEAPMEKMRRAVAERIVDGCGHRCFVCRKFVGHKGPCPGMVPRDPDATPLCHVDVRTGRQEDPFRPRVITGGVA